MKTVQYDYASLTKEDLVRHCESYAMALHELADRAMKSEWRLQMIQRNVLLEDGLK